jgi:hypothetical protein
VKNNPFLKAKVGEARARLNELEEQEELLAFYEEILQEPPALNN